VWIGKRSPGLAFIEAATANLIPQNVAYVLGPTRYVQAVRATGRSFPNVVPPGDAGFTGDLSVGLPYP
jgi:hypothetical protein